LLPGGNGLLCGGQRGEELDGDIEEEASVEGDEEEGNPEDVQSARDDEVCSALNGRYLQMMCQYFLARAWTGWRWARGTSEETGTIWRGLCMRYLVIIV
jgi:hypothetical protein